MKLEKQITFKVPISMGDKLENLAKEEKLISTQCRIYRIKITVYSI